MNIALAIGVAVMHAMMRGPPQNAFLPGRLGEECQHELPAPPQFVGAVAEIAVVTRCNAKHAHAIHRQQEPHPVPPERQKKHACAADVQKHEGNYRPEAVVVQSLDHSAFLACLGFPLTDGNLYQSVRSQAGGRIADSFVSTYILFVNALSMIFI